MYNRPRHQQARQPGEVGTDVFGHRTLEERQAHERRLQRHAQQVDGNGVPAEAAILASAAKQVRDAVAPVAHEVVVRQVDRAPGGEQVEHRVENVAQVGLDRVLGQQGHQRGQRDQRGHHPELHRLADALHLVQSGKDRRRGHVGAVHVHHVALEHADDDQPLHQRLPVTDDVDHGACGIFRAGRKMPADEHTQGHDQGRAQPATQARGPEGRARADRGGQVTRVVGHIRTEAQRPGGRLGQRQHEHRPGEFLARAGNVGRGRRYAEVPGRDQEQQTRNHGQDDTHAVDEFVADEGDKQRRRAEEHQGSGRSQRQQLAQRRFDQQAIGSNVERVGKYDRHQRQAGADDAELGPALHHLRNAQVRPLRRVGRHEDRADQVAQGQGDDGPGRRQAIGRGQRPHRHANHVEVDRKPDREQAQRRAVALGQRNEVDAVALDVKRADTGHSGSWAFAGGDRAPQ